MINNDKKGKIAINDETERIIIDVEHETLKDNNGKIEIEDEEGKIILDVEYEYLVCKLCGTKLLKIIKRHGNLFDAECQFCTYYCWNKDSALYEKEVKRNFPGKEKSKFEGKPR